MARISGSSVFSTVAALLPIRTKSLRAVRSKGLLTSTVFEGREVEEREREREREREGGREYVYSSIQKQLKKISHYYCHKKSPCM